MNDKILVLGKGFIGSRLAEYFRCPVSGQKISTFKQIYALIEKYKPTVLINCIGHTGKNNVDGCELAIDKTLFANTYIPILLAEASLRHNIRFVHISSGCIYHYDYARQKPITEARIPDYFDLYYSRSKIYAENVLTQLAKRHNILIARIRIPLDNRPHPKNILTKLIGYKRVINVPNSVTYIPDLMRSLAHLVRLNARGVYNIVCKRGLYYPALLDEYRKYRPDFQYQVIRVRDLKLARTNLILSTAKLERSGCRVRDISEVIDECVRDYVQS